MSRKLIIDGNAVYEIDEECMLKQRIRSEEAADTAKKNGQEKDRIKHSSPEQHKG